MFENKSMVLAPVNLRGTANGHLVVPSHIAVRMYLCPDLGRVRGPTKSHAILCTGLKVYM